MQISKKKLVNCHVGYIFFNTEVACCDEINMFSFFVIFAQ